MKKTRVLCLLFVLLMLLSSCTKAPSDGGETTSETISETETHVIKKTSIEDTGTVYTYEFDLNGDKIAEKIIVNRTIAEKTEWDTVKPFASIRILDGITGNVLWRDTLSMASDEKGEICLKKYKDENNSYSNRMFYYKYQVVPGSKTLKFTYYEFYFNASGEVVARQDLKQKSFSLKTSNDIASKTTEFSGLMQEINSYYECDQYWDVYILLDNTGERLICNSPDHLLKTDTLIHRYQLDDFYLGDAAQ